MNFPAHNIQNDLIFAPMHRYKNKPDFLIVVYMDDERHGTQAAKLIFEKGFDNVYLMSGGFPTFKKHFPEMIEKIEKGSARVSVGDPQAETVLSYYS